MKSFVSWDAKNDETVLIVQATSELKACRSRLRFRKRPRHISKNHSEVRVWREGCLPPLPCPSPPRRRRGDKNGGLRYPRWRSFLTYPGLVSETLSGFFRWRC